MSVIVSRGMIFFVGVRCRSGRCLRGVVLGVLFNSLTIFCLALLNGAVEIGAALIDAACVKVGRAVESACVCAVA